LLIQIDGKLFVPFDVEGVIDSNLHPRWLQSAALHRIRVLVCLRRLLSIAILVVDSDPAIMLAQKAVGYASLLLLLR